MREKVVVHPDFAFLSPFIHRISREDFPVERVFCCRRNKVVLTCEQGVRMVVKKYKRPTLFNCFVYTFFRPTKAQRAYRYAELLIGKGIETPGNIAYVEVKKHGFFHTGYFISQYLPYPTIERRENLSPAENRFLAEDFIAFTASLHRAGLVPGDYNPGNILYRKEGCRFRFALVDINRFHFGRADRARCMRSFVQLTGLGLTRTVALVRRYCSLRSWNTEQCLRLFLSLQKRLRIKQRVKYAVKSFLGIVP